MLCNIVCCEMCYVMINVCGDNVKYIIVLYIVFGVLGWVRLNVKYWCIVSVISVCFRCCVILFVVRCVM